MRRNSRERNDQGTNARITDGPVALGREFSFAECCWKHDSRLIGCAEISQAEGSRLWKRRRISVNKQVFSTRLWRCHIYAFIRSVVVNGQVHLLATFNVNSPRGEWAA
jgi:hypothetical protein